MKIPLVDLKAQYQQIKREMDQAIQEVISTTAFVGGPFVAAFEKAFAAFCSSPFCVGVGNGTDALYLAMKCAGVGHGDEVIVPANSFIATSEAVTLTGARVVFCDIDPQTYALDVSQLERLISSQTRVIIPVHLYGHPADMDPILNIAEAHHLMVIEDAAQAHGAEYNGKRVGTLGHMACFSFYPGKNLGAYGDGGAVVTHDPGLAEKVKMTANHGRTQKYDHLFEGVNSRLDAMQAAVLQTKLKYLESWTEQRRAHARRYSSLLEGAGVITPFESPNVRAVYHLYVIRVEGGKRDALRDYLNEQGISTAIHYPIALPELKAYAYLGLGPNDFPVASRYSKEILSLPMYPELTEEQINYVAQNIRQFLETQ